MDFLNFIIAYFALSMTGDGSYIDGLCLEDDACCSNHSHCKLGLCRCLPGYVPSVDNRKCIGKSSHCCHLLG